VLFAIVAASMLAVVGLLYSFGLVLDQRRSLQGAADAASLAGTWQVLAELASDNRCDANVNAAVTTYATANGAVATAMVAVYVDANGNTLGTVGSFATCPAGQFPATARGVAVTVSGTLPTILPGFVRIGSLNLSDSSTAVARPIAPPAAEPVIPIAVAASSYSAHASYDLFAHPPAGATWSTLELSSVGAPQYPNSTTPVPATEAQYWSDGQHLGSWQLSQPATVKLASAANYDSVAAGLSDNVRRQALIDGSNRAYALVLVPIYDSVTTSPPAVHVIGFAQLKILGSQLSATSAIGTFVPYASAAFGTPAAPSPDVGNTLVMLSS
jgi:Flp pilus assembly protein TadG